MTSLFRLILSENVLRLHKILYILGSDLEADDLIDSDILEELQIERNIVFNLIMKKFLEFQPFFKEKHIVMREYFRVLVNLILKGDITYATAGIKIPKLLKKLTQDSVLKENSSKPYWNGFSEEKSKELWLPIKANCSKLETECLDQFSKNLATKTWFSTTFQAQNQLNSSLEIDKSYVKKKSRKRKVKKKKKVSKEVNEEWTEDKEVENNDKSKQRVPKIIEEYNAIKLRIYPNFEQKQTLRRWFGIHRLIYNKCLDYAKENNVYKINKYVLKDIRDLIINNDNYERENRWMLEVPYEIRDNALRDLKNNYNSNVAKMENGNNNRFNIKFKSRNDTDSIQVLSKYWNTTRGMYSGVFTSRMKCERALPKKLNHTCRLIRTKTNKYYLCIPRLIKNKSKNTQNNINSKVISLDPGVRTFQTGYDPKGLIVNIGEEDVNKLLRLAHYKNKLQGRIATLPSVKSKRIKKAFVMLSERIQNLVNELHKKTSIWLCKNYNQIVVSRLNFHSFKRMSKKNRAKMAILSHCRFVDRLINKSREFTNCQVIVVTEEYTSKTCSCCGKINDKLGSSKTFNCEKCKNVFDRDSNGARGILLKHYT